MSDRPELLNFIEFFETEPEWVHELGWYYGARFVTRREQDVIAATVAPDEGEFYIEWRQAERCLMKLKLVMVQTWQLQKWGDKEQLTLEVVSDRRMVCILTLKPIVSIELEDSW